MRKITLCLLISVLFIFQACSKKDDNPQPTTPNTGTDGNSGNGGEETKKATITLSDFTVTIDEGQKADDVLGKVEGSISDNSTLKYSIVSQTPENAIKIEESTGEIKVNDATLFKFSTNPTINAKFKASNGTVEKEANITININEPKPFKIKIQGSSFGETVINVLEGYEYDYTIDWGDGTVEENQTGDAKHTYDNYAEYEVSITGKFPALSFENLGFNLLAILEWGTNKWQSTTGMFKSCRKITLKNASDVPNLSEVEDMSSMFQSCSAITDVDLNSWKVDNVKNMESLFYFSGFEGDVSQWNVAKVTNMKRMFYFCSKFNSNISAWKVGEVTDFNSMFSFCEAFAQDLSGWDISSSSDPCPNFGSSLNDALKLPACPDQ